jgi:hypothetical protein
MAQPPAGAQCVKHDGQYVFILPAPDLTREKMIGLNTEGAEVLGARLGQVPSRATLYRWRKEGYPVTNEGPIVRLPAVERMRKPMTSVESLSLFLETITAVSDQVSGAGSIGEWENRYGKRAVRETA